MTSPPAHTSPHRARNTRAAVECATRDNIVRAALILFAKHGIDGVSLRQIVAAAGQSNPSAIHYHFHSKEGLIQAVIKRVSDDLTPRQARAMNDMFQAQAQGSATTVRQVVLAAALPFIELYTGSHEGRMTVRFLSRLTWQRQPLGQSALFEQIWNYWRDVVVLLHPLLPDMSIDVLMQRGVLVGCTLLHGLADMSLLKREKAFGMAELLEQQPQALLDHFIDFVSGGLSAPVHSAHGHDTTRFSQVA